jgi:hypothetical protein
MYLFLEAISRMLLFRVNGQPRGREEEEEEDLGEGRNQIKINGPVE